HHELGPRCRAVPEKPDDRRRGLLRTRAERPRHCRATEQSHELAPFHCSAHPVLPTKRIAHSSVRQETTALRHFKPAYGRNGSFSWVSADAARGRIPGVPGRAARRGRRLKVGEIALCVAWGHPDMDPPPRHNIAPPYALHTGVASVEIRDVEEGILIGSAL